MKKIKRLLCLSLVIAITATAYSNIAPASAVIGGEDFVSCQYSETEMTAIIQKQILKDTIDFDEYEESNISPLYAESVHRTLIDEAKKGADSIGKTLKNVYWNDMEEICVNCDSLYTVAKNSYNSPIHGNRNYYATLKYLWTYALKISKSSTLSLSKQCDQVASECLALFDCDQFETARGADGVKDYTYLPRLGAICKEVILNYATSSDYTGNKVEYRKFLVFGLIMHYFGDIAAHRTRVTHVMIDRMTDPDFINGQNRFTRSNFSDTEWARLTARISAKNIDFTTIATVYSSSNTNGILDSNNSSTSRISYIRGRYEDNVKVIPSRLSEAKLNAYWFMQHYLEGYNAGVLAPVYNIDYVFADKYYQATW